MKNIIIIGISLVLLIVASVLVWRHFRDAELRRQIVGSWTNRDRFVMTITPDGSFSFGTSPSHDEIGGTWRIKDGVFITTTTKSPRNNALAGGVVRYRIIHLNDHQFVFELGGDKTTTTLTRR